MPAAFADLSTAFDEAIDDYIDRKRFVSQRSIFATLDNSPAFKRTVGRDLHATLAALDRNITLVEPCLQRGGVFGLLDGVQPHL